MRRRALIGLVGAALLLGAGVGFASGWFARGSPNLPDVPELTAGRVPDVTGLQREWAEVVLKSVGLLPVVNPVGGADDDVVVAQNPRPGVNAPSASTVLMDVRCFPAPCPAPRAGETIYDPCSCASR